MKRPHRVARAGAWLTLAAIAVGTTLLGAAMRLYPGGNAGDHTRAGHSFWRNYLCDVTTDVAVNGADNTAGAALARGGMLTLSLTLGLALAIAPRLLRGGRATTAVVRGGGALCALGLVAVPFAPLPWHAAVVLATVVPGVSAMGATLVGLWRARRGGLVGLALGALAASVVDAVLYAAKVTGHLSAASPFVPAVQRLAGLLLVAWMAAVAAAVLSERPTPSPREAGRGLG
jgi:hypothetical protein